MACIGRFDGHVLVRTNLAHRGHEFVHLGVRSLGNLQGKGVPIPHREVTITDKEPQAHEREVSLIAAEHVTNPLLFLGARSQHHNFTLVEVDSEARHALKAYIEE
jgi:hypothetical protein